MNKVDIAKASDNFVSNVNLLKSYMLCCSDKFSDDKSYLSHSYEYGIISLYKEFESYIYRLIVGCVNRDNATVSRTYNVQFGQHIRDDVCEFIITKGGYFDFRGRDGLIKLFRQNVGSTYGIISVISDCRFKNDIEMLCTLRNFAAHTSSQAKLKAMEVTGMSRIASAGSYLKNQIALIL